MSKFYDKQCRIACREQNAQNYEYEKKCYEHKNLDFNFIHIGIRMKKETQRQQNLLAKMFAKIRMYSVMHIDHVK